MSDADRNDNVEEIDDKYSSVEADDTVEDAEQLFEQHHEGPPLTANPEADPE
ncbi:MAG: hypothetical protein ACRDZ2_14710 [Ilumatobacteraceae bacterium]